MQHTRVNIMEQSTSKKRYFTTPAIVAYIVIILIVIGIYFVLSNQQTPFTSNGYVLSANKAHQTLTVEGFIPENAFSHLKKGQRSLVVLAMHPGKIFKGSISSVGYPAQTNANHVLPKIETNNWFKHATLFPITIKLSSPQFQKKTPQIGSTISAVALKKGSSLWNGLACFTMWVKSMWAYM